MTQINEPAFDPASEDLFVDPPKWPKVVGILSMVFGGISVFCGAIGLAFLPFQEGLMASQLQGDPAPPSMMMSAVDWAIGAGNLGANGLLIAAGLVCIGRKRLGRSTHLIYGLVMIPVAILGTLVNIQKQEATAQWAAEYPNNPMAQSIQQQQDIGVNFGVITVLVMLVITLAWPLFCLIWFGLVKTKLSHFTGDPASDEHPLDVV